MSMPKGQKFENGYATVDEKGMGYREIADEMTDRGMPMKKSMARNHFRSAMRKLAKTVKDVNPNVTVEQLADDPRFQSAIAAYIKSGGINL